MCRSATFSANLKRNKRIKYLLYLTPPRPSPPAAVLALDVVLLYCTVLYCTVLYSPPAAVLALDVVRGVCWWRGRKISSVPAPRQEPLRLLDEG